MMCPELSCRWSLTAGDRHLMQLTGDRGDGGRRALPGGAVAGLPGERGLGPGLGPVRRHGCHHLDGHGTEPLMIVRLVKVRQTVDHN